VARPDADAADGHQAAGTRGRQLLEGVAEVKIHGRWIPVHARIARLDSISAHADRGEILRWLSTLPAQPGRLCLVHAEEGPMDGLLALIRDRLDWTVHMPVHQERIEL
jgi:metallo-beta-lactamase family protein